MRALVRAGCLLVTVALTGCGGGSGNESIVGPPPPPAPEAIGGIWEGTSTSSFSPGVVTSVVGLITESGDARLVTSDSVQIVTTSPLTVTGTTVTGNLRAYAPVGFTFADGSRVVSGTLSATISGRDSLSGSWSSATGEGGDFDFLYSASYERGSSIAFLTDLWVGIDAFGNISSSFDIDTNGAIAGADTLGCIYTGQVSLIDTRFNAYAIEATVTNCGVANGTYTGLGALSDDRVDNDVLVFQIDNGLLVVTDFLLRN